MTHPVQFSRFRKRSSEDGHFWEFYLGDVKKDVECTSEGWIECADLVPSTLENFLALVVENEEKGLSDWVLMCEDFSIEDGKYYARDFISAMKLEIQAWRPSPENDLSRKIEDNRL